MPTTNFPVRRPSITLLDCRCFEGRVWERGSSSWLVLRSLRLESSFNGVWSESASTPLLGTGTNSKNYGGGGQIIVGRYTQMMFYVLTVALIGIAGLIFRTDKGSWQARVARYECGALLIALVAWSIVLASSLVVFRWEFSVRPASLHAMLGGGAKGSLEATAGHHARRQATESRCASIAVLKQSVR